MRSLRANFLIFGERGVQRYHIGNAAFSQHIELIFHQRDQRTNDDRGSFEEKRGQLIGETLPGAGRQNGKRILSRYDTRDNFFLTRVERIEPELFLKRSAQIHCCSYSLPTE